MVDSTIEVEYIVLSNAIKKIIEIKTFVIKLRMVPSIVDLIDLYCDNNGVITQANKQRSHQQSKHILKQFHLIKRFFSIVICKYVRLVWRTIWLTH